MGWFEQHGEGLDISVKVVPGASRDRVVGVLGDALKIQVSAPPERGKANIAVMALIAELFDVAERDVSILRGTSSPRKVLRVRGVSAEVAEAAIRK